MLFASSSLTSTLGVIAPLLTVLQCVAQAMRINRAGAVGVSLSTWVLSAFVAETWLGYGLSFHVPAELYANVAFLSVAGYVVLVAARSQNVMRQASGSFMGATALAVLVSLTGLSHHWRWILAAIAGGGAVVIYLPQMMMTLRSRNLVGVSIVSWALALVTGVAWALYGVLIHQPPISLPTVVMIPTTVVILIQVTRHRLRGRALAGSLAPVVE
ncbi:MAG: PQ-loop repeat-containing protein [Acidimicrobiales bacterium]